MPNIFAAASHVTTPIGLVAFVVAIAIWFVDRNLKSKSKETHLLLRLTLGGCLVVVLVWLCGELYLRHEAAANSVYRVRVNVTGTTGLPEGNAKVSSSVGGESKVVAGGFEFDIPFASKPADGSVVFSANTDDGGAKGDKTLTLGDDRFPTISINLLAVQSAVVRGTVEDESGRTIGGVTVSVVGYGEESVITSANGGFVLPAHVADGKTVKLHAEGKRYAPLDQDHPAGTFPATLVLHRDNAHH
jgi:hypothetical protein